MFEYEKKATLSLLNRKLEDFQLEMDRLEGEGDLQHIAPNDEGWTLPNEEYVWLALNLKHLSSRIAGLEPIVAIPDIPGPVIYSTDGEC